MVATDLSTFMNQVIERVGKRPTAEDQQSYSWFHASGWIKLQLSDREADLVVTVFMEAKADDLLEDTFFHTYELTDNPAWDHMSQGSDATLCTYDSLVEVVATLVSSTIR